jgi:hypothetical protein
MEQRLQKMWTTLAVVSLLLNGSNNMVNAKLADRGRLVEMRNDKSYSSKVMNSRVYGKHTKPVKELPIEGPKYRGKDRWEAEMANHVRQHDEESKTQSLRGGNNKEESLEDFERDLSQLSGCCTTYSSYSADNMCYKYGENCATGAEPSHDSGDDDCAMAGLSFIGISFSVNTASGSPYSYQLCDQFYMENIIDRDYNYVMSMDEDGWLVGGGYKSFDYSGKMPYIDSSHTELLRIGSLDPEYGYVLLECSFCLPPCRLYFLNSTNSSFSISQWNNCFTGLYSHVLHCVSAI